MDAPEDPPPRRRRIWIGLSLASSIVIAIGIVLLVIPYSRSCDEERGRARAAWTRYAEALEGDARQTVLAVRAEVDDPRAALEDAELLAPPPSSEADMSARYREAMDTLSLAAGACGG